MKQKKTWAKYTEVINQIRVEPHQKKWLFEQSYAHASNPTQIIRVALDNLMTDDDATTILLEHLPEHPYKQKIEALEAL